MTCRELSTRITRNTSDGRGARAIALQCRADGVPIDDKEAEDLVNSYHTMYPKVKEFLQRCKDNVNDENGRKCQHYVESLFGRKRRFIHDPSSPLGRDLLAAEQREACNAPIQATVADAVNVAIFNLLSYRFHHPELRYRIAMQIHDALLLEVHKDDAAFVYSTLMKDCMVNQNPIKVVRDNVEHEYHFAIESDMSVHWGEPITDEIARRELGCDVKYLQEL